MVSLWYGPERWRGRSGDDCVCGRDGMSAHAVVEDDRRHGYFCSRSAACCLVVLLSRRAA